MVPYNDPAPNRFGKIHASLGYLYVGFKNIEICFGSYDVLCMRGTPASLLSLSRISIRHTCLNSNEKIAKINITPDGKKYCLNYLLSISSFPHF